MRTVLRREALDTGPSVGDVGPPDWAGRAAQGRGERRQTGPLRPARGGGDDVHGRIEDDRAAGGELLRRPEDGEAVGGGIANAVGLEGVQRLGDDAVLRAQQQHLHRRRQRPVPPPHHLLEPAPRTVAALSCREPRPPRTRRPIPARPRLSEQAHVLSCACRCRRKSGESGPARPHGGHPGPTNAARAARVKAGRWRNGGESSAARPPGRPGRWSVELRTRRDGITRPK